MLKLPAIPAHVAKVIAYAEGYGEWVVNALIIVAATVPAHNLSPSMGAALVVANRFLNAASTRLGQFIILTKGAGVEAPVTPKVLAGATGDVQAVSTVVAPQVAADIEHPNVTAIFDQVTADEAALVGPADAPPAPEPLAPVVPESAIPAGPQAPETAPAAPPPAA